MADDNSIEIRIGATLDASLEASLSDVSDSFDRLQAVAVPALAGIGSGVQGVDAELSRSLATLNQWTGALGGVQQKAPRPGGGDDGRQAEAARKSAEQTQKIWDEVADKRIEGEARTNTQLYALGEESLQQMVAQARDLEDQRYAIAIEGVARRMAADAGNSAAEARDDAQAELALQDHVNRRAQIEAQYAAKAEAADQQATREFVAAQQEKLSAAMAADGEASRSHEMSASERAQAELASIAAAKQAIDERLAFEMEGYEADSKGAATLESEKERLDQQFARQHAAVMNQLVQDDTHQWTSLLAPFNSTLNQMLGGHTKWSAMIAGLERQLIMKLIETGEQDAVAWIVREQTKTTATIAGNAARTASTSAAAASSAASEGGWMKQSALGHAYNAAAATWDSVSQIPYVGYILAPAAAAATLAAVLALGGNIPSFAKGSWELPQDMLAQVHKGEMIVPAGPAAQMRSGFAVPSAGAAAASAMTEHHWSYAPTIQGVPERNVMDELRASSGEFMSFIQGLSRNGAMRFA